MKYLWEMTKEEIEGLSREEMVELLLQAKIGIELRRECIEELKKEKFMYIKKIETIKEKVHNFYKDLSI